LNVIVPVGFDAPVSVATSEMSSPSAELGTAWDEIDGVDAAALLTPPVAAAIARTATATMSERRAGFMCDPRQHSADLNS
jgi:hypothetical protein